MSALRGEADIPDARFLHSALCKRLMSVFRHPWANGAVPLVATLMVPDVVVGAGRAGTAGACGTGPCSWISSFRAHGPVPRRGYQVRRLPPAAAQSFDSDNDVDFGQCFEALKLDALRFHRPRHALMHGDPCGLEVRA